MTQPNKVLFTEVSPFKDGKQYTLGDWKKIPEIVHDAKNIKGFFGDFRWLSNFGPGVVLLDGVQFEGVERAYQAAKWRPEQREFFTTCSNNESIIFNRDHTPGLYTPSEWDVAKVGVMRHLLVQKFDPELNPENAARLAETGSRYLEETNWWGDIFWGKSLAGEGANNLGVLLMDIRDGRIEPTAE